MYLPIFALLSLFHLCQGQEDESSACYGPGSIALAVILTVIVLFLSLYILAAIWKRYRIRKGKHLVLETDPEKGPNDIYAYDNAGFKEVPSSGGNNTFDKLLQWSSFGSLTRKTLDDSSIPQARGEIKTVAMKGHDFAGLGFNIHGNMRDGIFIKDVLHRGPASESGKLNPGDRIKSVTINFEHVVYEDALAILGSASPYEVVLVAHGGKSVPHISGDETAQIPHPLHRSSSTADLIRIRNKVAKKQLFPSSQVPSYSQKTPDNQDQKNESKHQKFGIKVLPALTVQHIAPKSTEHFQNDNNINLERQSFDRDELDKAQIAALPPPVRKREKSVKREPDIETTQEVNVPELDIAFDDRGSACNSSGIRRDKDGIPQEIPGHMLNAAMAARRHRNGSVDTEESKSAKRSKGRAPAPPDDKLIFDNESHVKTPLDYGSDSDNDTNINDSVNTIELDSSDITIHQAEDAEEIRNRKTVSTGDLTKIQKLSRKSSNGALERAQSLDITDTALPSLAKKRKGGSIEESFDLDGFKTLAHKEPRLSLALDGLNTFQRSRLKKSTEWGNLEDAVLDLDQTNGTQFEALIHKIDEIKHDTFRSEEIIQSESLTTLSDNNRPNEHCVLRENIDVSSCVEIVNVLPEHNFPTRDNDETSSIVEFVNVSPEQEIPSHTLMLSENFLLAERGASDADPYYYSPFPNKMCDINVSDDMKVSRHSIGSLETIDNLKHLSNDEFSMREKFSSTIDGSTNDEAVVKGSGDQIILENENVEEAPPKLVTKLLTTVSPATQHCSKSYITEIKVSATNENGLKNDASTELKSSKMTFTLANEPIDPQKELHKIREIAEEQLKKLPEMRFSTSSYETKSSESGLSHIDELRSNFEKSPPKTPTKSDPNFASKSRIPVATAKTPPTSPERRDSRNFDMEIDKDIVAIMTSPVYSIPITTGSRYQPKSVNKNVSITSIRNNSKIPSGLPSRPPVPPRKHESFDVQGTSRLSSSNGNMDSSFKQWVFNPNDGSPTNLTITSKTERK